MMEIRPVRPEDVRAVRDLHRRALPAEADAGPGPWDDDLLDPLASYADGAFLVGVLDARVVAMGALRRAGTDTVELKRMRVDPCLQRRGYGEAMLLALEDRARVLGATRAILDTTHVQTAAIALYSKHGYRETSRRRLSRFELVLFEKPLYRAPGEQVVWRSRPDGTVGYTFPATVIDDGPRFTALYQHPGSAAMRRTGERGGPRGRNLVAWDGGHAEAVWHAPGIVKVHPAGEPFAVVRGYEDGAFRGWYVNLEDPWRRTHIGFDSRDNVLDVAVAPDLTGWWWKDADELGWLVELGRMPAEHAARIGADGERAIAALEARAFPFGEDWSRWTPDERRPVPVLPDGWDRPTPAYPAPASGP